MKSNRQGKGIQLVGALVVLGLAGAGIFAAEPPPYGIIDLGTLPDAPQSHAYGVNELGQVVGVAGTTSSDGVAFLFTDANGNGQSDPGEMIDLGTFGGPQAIAYEVNNLGHAAGMATNDVETNPNGWPTHQGRPFIYRDGELINLGYYPPHDWLTLASAINDLGQVVGRAGDMYTTGLAVLWDPETFEMTSLPNLPGHTRLGRAAFDINNQGIVTGAVSPSDAAFDVVAVIWQEIGGDWEATSLGALPEGAHFKAASVAMAINDVGQVVGWSWASNPDYPEAYPNHAFLVTPEDGSWYRDDDLDGINDLILDLGTLGGMHSNAWGINNSGAVVGYAQHTPGDYHGHAVLWLEGVIYDLNDYIDPNSAWELEKARAINNAGQIVGSGINPAGEKRAFLLTPQPGDCNFNGIPDEQDIAEGTSEDCNDNGTPDECEPDCNVNGVPDDCDIASGTSADCNLNDIPDDCEPDCNGNGVADACDIADGTSTDCTGNGLPDECEPDCNVNGVADSCDLADGTSADCNTNAIPDSCDIADATSPDCNTNGTPDECELPPIGQGPDCNNNAVPDECDIADGTSDDCNANNLPDECEFVDCNSNGILDVCDLANGTSQDQDGSGVPDECDGRGFTLVPVSADCPHTVSGSTIHLEDVGCRITFNIRVSGWDLDEDGMPLLDLYQAQIDSKGFTSGDTGSLSFPWIDIPCAVDADCPGYGAVCEPDGYCETTGAFFVDESDPDWVFFGQDNISVVDISQPDIRVGSLLWNDAIPISDPGYPKYAATLILDVSADATGVFTVGFLPGDCCTFMANPSGSLITVPTLNPATIVLPPDCNGNLVPDSQDISDGTSEDCNGNGVPDECDIAEGRSGDCNDNAMPDECEDCNGNGYADECDLLQGTSLDDDGNGIPDECDAVPTVAAIGGRYIDVTPSPGDEPCAIVIGCPGSISYYATAPDERTGVSRWVSDIDDAAILTPLEWGGTVRIIEEVIRSDTTYDIRADYVGRYVSTAAQVTTPKWGDAVGTFDGQAWTPPNGVVDFLDVTARVDAFKHLPTAPSVWLVDMWPAMPDGTIDFVDIASSVNAFRQLPDPYGVPCP